MCGHYLRDHVSQLNLCGTDAKMPDDCAHLTHITNVKAVFEPHNPLIDVNWFLHLPSRETLVKKTSFVKRNTLTIFW